MTHATICGLTIARSNSCGVDLAHQLCECAFGSEQEWAMKEFQLSHLHANNLHTMTSKIQ
jgi:hypothetical protein